MRSSRRGRAFAASLLLAALVSTSCRPTPPAAAPPLFELLAPSATGVAFANMLPDSTDFNIVSYLYYYNGGGVAVGDVNGDGLPDLYFSANVGPNRLYLNRGNYRFEDVTTQAGVAGPPGWKTGVTMADVNGDGRPDIFASAVNYLSMHGHVVLYINNGDGTFTDRTDAYGLAYDGYATQAVFFDYDGDGDLDLYLQSHSTTSERQISSAATRTIRNPRTGGRLYRNDGGHFTDVSAQAGIYASADGYGLGVVASDLDADGCPDLYVANDFQENDYLYHNNCNGTFTESIARATGHTSRFSMGADAADVNNDGRADVFVGDMMPEREDVLKTSASSESYNLFNLRLQAGYRPQYARNTLQINRGDGRFSEVGYLAGVYATDWSWASLLADLDNDGRKDLFVTSGIYRRPNDLDYINYASNDAVQAGLAQGGTKADLALLAKMPHVPVANHAYRNDGDLRFTDMAAAWGLGQMGFSNGAAYVDLNNSGALDLVVNNVNAPAAIYRNRARERNGNAFLTVTLRGAGANTAGIGTKVIVRQHGTTQLVEQMPTRGLVSSVDQRLHLGLGRDTVIDSLVVIWPDRRFQVMTQVKVNRGITLVQDSASGRFDYATSALVGRAPAAATFEDVTAQVPMDYRHTENSVSDFDREPLMPHLLSAEGPALAVADVDGDGLDDVFAGGAKWQPAKLLLQQRDGSFKASAQPEIAADSVDEDVDAVFLDADGDGHPDLFVVSGGNEFWGDAPALAPRLYLNDGHGHFRRSVDAVPGVFENGSCAVVGDFDRDGHPDIFLGARVVSRQYGAPPRSHLLRNDGHGHFVDVTDKVAPGLADAGMVTSAAWIDYDGDGALDLVVAGEWTAVRLFHQVDGHFVERTKESGFGGTEGWWTSVVAADLDGDGRTDLALGNLGRNAYVTASAKDPARMYVGDFGHNGTLEQVLTFYKQGKSYPVIGRDDIVKLIPPLRSKFPSYEKFGASTVEDIFPESDLKEARMLEAHTFASAVAMNRGDGTFALRPMPTEAQFAPVRAMLAGDFDGDGRTDLLLGGNDWGVPPVFGRYDASIGLLLHGAGGGAFAAVDAMQSGVVLLGQVRQMRALRGADGQRLVLVARNDSSMQVLRVRSGRSGAGATYATGHEATAAAAKPAARGERRSRQ